MGILAGCAGAPPRLYVLTPLPPGAPNGGNSANGPTGARRRSGRSIGVQPVTMPEYLDRPEIVAHTAAHELSANRDDQWAERLPTNVTRVLAENLSVLLDTDRVRVMPARDGDRFDYEVAVDFDRFERTVSGDSALAARWAIRDGATGKVLVRDETRLSTPVPASGYPALVAAMNDNLTALSRDIAAAIGKLPQKGGARTRS
ncbi:PqiC family protein [Azospirillum rugosum]|uniref:Lipoprotein YmbA n=1 Tax=Azospirillum rugosum TaxID=416170 RepID=A0ABS4STC6_9PROT|nr:PqiC family protein [Azospirillum rugosum]MBP2295816.1 putative lipoprotein YmbA [Azospirillum rugosum]MDQ0529073.1 putative lipoprotein YmbA [Azospirillum rugosum]